jgi:type I restriction enzyme S subunit
MKTHLFPLSELGEIVSGSTPRTEVGEFWNGDIPWVTPADLTSHDGIWFRGKPKHITKAGFDSCSTRMLPCGSILFSSRAPIGHCALACYPLCTNQGFKSLVPNDLLDPVYGYFAIRSATPSIIARGRGATFAEVSTEIMESIQIPVPTLHEQQRIAAQLEKADRLRRTRRYALELGDSFLQSVLRKMFRDKPKANEIARLGDLIRSGPTNGLYKSEEFLGDGVLFLDIKGLYRSLEADFTSARRVRVSEKELKKYGLSNGDVLINRVSKKAEGVGKSVLVSNLKEPAVYESNMMRIRLNESKVLPCFLVHYLSTAESRRQLLRSANISNQASINQDSVNGLRVLVPPLSRQQTFINLVNRFTQLRAQQRESLRQAEHLFQTLLHRAFAPQKLEREEEFA